MSGYTKHAYENDIRQMSKEFSGYIKSISRILPKEYNKNDILSLLKQYYPYEWRILLEKYDAYQRADKKLIKLNKKPRYKMIHPEKFILSLHISKNILNNETRKLYSNNFSESKRKAELKLLEEKRLPK
ncbi:MAG: hypothetical protein NC489_36875 [Ruminococcus flavefaciens]|nr:hypothetical protein [Ruminococcus flavefaciens]